MSTFRLQMRFCAVAVCLVASLAALPATIRAEETAESRGEPLDFLSPPELLVARTRYAWSTSMAPDETWIATGYGHWGANEAGRVVVWDLATAAPRWRANEPRGVRSVAVSHDGTLVASGNFGGQIRLRDAATGKLLRSFQQDRGSVERICFSSTDKRLVTSSNTTNLIRIWDAATGEVLQTLTGHTQVPYWVEFSSDDRLIVSAGRDATIRIWNAGNGSLQHTLAHPAEVSSAVFLPGDKQIASVAHDGLVRLWNVATCKLETTLTPPETRSAACAAAVSRDGRLLASGNFSRIHVWELASGELRTTLEGHRGLVHGLAFDKEGKRLVSTAWDESVRIWEVEGGRQRQVLTLPASGSEPTGPIAALAYCPKRSLIAAASGAAAIDLRAAADGKLLKRLEAHEGVVQALAYSPGGEWLASAGADGKIHLWSVETNKAEVTLPHHTGAISAVAWSPDGTRLISGGDDQTVRIFDTQTWKELAMLEGHSAAVLGVGILPGGRAVSVGEDSIVRVWDIAAGKQAAALVGHAGAIRAVAVAPGGAVFATAGDDKGVKLWDTASLKLRATVGGHQQPVLCLAFSPQGQTLASGAAGGGLHYLDPVRGTIRKTTSTQMGRVTAVAFLPHAAGVLAGGQDETIRLWRAGEVPIAPLIRRQAHGDSAFAASFSPDGKWLATGGKDALVALRNPQSGDIVQTLRGHKGLIYEVAFSPDSRLLASASADGTVRLWSVETGAMVASFQAWKDKLSGVRTAAFAPDNRMLVAGASDGTLRLFDATQQKPIKDLTSQAAPLTGASFSPDGLLLATCTGDWQRWRLPGELRLWDVKTGEEVAALEGHPGEIKRVVFSGSGKRMASVGGPIIVWDVAARKATATFRVGVSPTAVTFLKDENLLALGDAQGGVTIWDISSQRVVHRFVGHDKLVAGIAVSPDGQRLVTAAHDGTIKLWPVPATTKLP